MTESGEHAAKVARTEGESAEDAEMIETPGQSSSAVAAESDVTSTALALLPGQLPRPPPVPMDLHPQVVASRMRDAAVDAYGNEETMGRKDAFVFRTAPGSGCSSLYCLLCWKFVDENHGTSKDHYRRIRWSREDQDFYCFQAPDYLPSFDSGQPMTSLHVQAPIDATQSAATASLWDSSLPSTIDETHMAGLWAAPEDEGEHGDL